MTQTRAASQVNAPSTVIAHAVYSTAVRNALRGSSTAARHDLNQLQEQ